MAMDTVGPLPPSMLNSSFSQPLDDENIRVGVRMRPFDSKELEEKEEMAWKIEPRKSKRKDSTTSSRHRRMALVQLKRAPATNSHRKAPPLLTFDGFKYVYGPKCTTSDVYSGVAFDIVQSSLDGFNGTIFAYGPTASGKTYTMKGCPDELGIIPRALHHIFQQFQQSPDRQFLLRVSYMEVYREKVKDLLVDNGDDLTIREDKERGFFVQDLTEPIVTSVDEVIEHMNDGETRRHYASTGKNDLSSRSHTIFQLIIESKPNNAPKSKVRVSHLNFVDLAGSERIKQTKVKGKVANEGRAINLSLHKLGNVIMELVNNPNGHISYRDSALTRILQPSLGGNTRTAIICTVSPALSNLHHTVSTLRFGKRALCVRTHAKINEVTSSKAWIDKHPQKSKELHKRLSTMSFNHSDNLDDNEDEVLESIKRNMEIHTQKLRTIIMMLTEPQNDKKSGHRRRKSFATGMKYDLLLPNAGSVDDEKKDSDPLWREQLEAKLKLHREMKAADDTVIQELMMENEELLAQVNDGLSVCAELEEQLQESQANMNLLNSGDGLESMTEETLRTLQISVQESLSRIQKAIMFHEFKRAGLLKDSAAMPDPAKQDEFAQLQQEKSSLMSQLHSQQLSMAAVRDQVAGFEVKLKDSEQRLKKREEELIVKIEDAQATATSANDRASELQQKLDDAQACIQKQEEEKKKLQQQIEELRASQLEKDMETWRNFESQSVRSSVSSVHSAMGRTSTPRFTSPARRPSVNEKSGSPVAVAPSPLVPSRRSSNVNVTPTHTKQGKRSGAHLGMLSPALDNTPTVSTPVQKSKPKKLSDPTRRSTSSASKTTPKSRSARRALDTPSKTFNPWASGT